MNRNKLCANLVFLIAILGSGCQSTDLAPGSTGAGPALPVTSTGLTYANGPKFGNCPIFSDQYVFNQRVDDPIKFPVLPNSPTMIKNMNLVGNIPVFTTTFPMLRTVGEFQALRPLTCDPAIAWCPNSMIGAGIMIPYPQDIDIVSGHDHHAYVIQETFGPPAGVQNPITSPSLPPGATNCYLYETWWTGRIVNSAAPTPQPITIYVPGSNVTGFTGGGFSVFDLKRDISYTPAGVGGSTASNISIFAGTVTYDEAIGDTINHALAVALPLLRYSYISPAKNAQLPLYCGGVMTNQTPQALQNLAAVAGFPCDLYNPNLPAMGQRFRLKSSFNEAPYANYPIAKAVVHALKKHGMILTDGAGGILFRADNDPRWIAHQWPDIQSLKQLAPSDFEAIESGPAVNVQAPPTIVNVPNSAIYN